MVQMRRQLYYCTFHRRHDANLLAGYNKITTFGSHKKDTSNNMEENDNVFRNHLISFNSQNAPVKVLEQRVPIETQMEYFSYSNKLRGEEHPAIEDYQIYKDRLQSPISVDEKRNILSLLAIAYSTQAYRIIEEYVAENTDPELADWGFMALMESKIALESDLLDERMIYISTGLGGKADKLRFYILLTSKNNIPLLEYQKHVIKTEFEYNLPKHDCELERINITDFYAEILMLIPMFADIKEKLDIVIQECNQYGDFISDTITITNVKELTQEEINEICKKNN
jgi:hypothetical protein